jgi:hypothetical protein
MRPRRLGGMQCFVCGNTNEQNMTDEDVFPKWLQRRFNLQSRELNLLNGTSLRYSRAKAFCCDICNNISMSQVENRVAQALQSGYAAFSNLDRIDLFLWTAKIFYGLLAVENKLPKHRDKRLRTDPEGEIEPIVSERMLADWDLFRSYVQGFNKKIDIIGPLVIPPVSIMIFQLKQPSDVRGQFHFRDSYELLFLSARLGEIGLIVSHRDFGTIEIDFRRSFPDAFQHTLHPLQFAELTARALYSASRIQDDIKYTVFETAKSITIYISEPDRNVEEYDGRKEAHVISHCTKLPSEMFLDQQGFARGSLLATMDGKFDDMDFDETIVAWPL